MMLDWSSRSKAAAQRTWITAVVAVVAFGGGAVPATAAPGSTGTQYLGVVRLFSHDNFTGPVFSTSYRDCADAWELQIDRVVASFENRPPVGCQVRLQNSRYEHVVLCFGRDVIPINFRWTPRLRIQPGPTPPCRF